MTSHNAGRKPEQKVFETLRSDIQRGDILDSIRREILDTREFLLDEGRRKKLEGMNPVKGWLLSSWWMLKGMLFRLTPARRILFVAGVLLVLVVRSSVYEGSDVQVHVNTTLIGALCLILVLMLELKDKLVAREELEAGRVVQDALQPERSPHLPGWNLWLFTRSANEVGGDLVDFIRLGDARAGVVLGDVAGKGLRAALLMAKLQATVRALAEDFTSLSDLASKLNRIFCRDSLKNIFASMVYVELVSGTGRIRLVNAGHFPPLVARAGGIEAMAKGGAALGLTTSAEYREQELTLGAGELLCAYSDGVSEAQNVAGDFFGEPRIREILQRNVGAPVDMAGTELVNVVDRFVGEAKRRDDLTLLIVGRAP
ncbi:MAG TPA: PP2C family protein-serine/threonine phosphatase [Bacteroidota bacterium]|nr:PP2C family protein-serine/threonine phosphatase [Bacteroidota bacterium]